MKHLYENHEGETIAADTLEDAARYHDCELGGAAEPEEGWSQVPDNASIPILDGDDDKPGETITKTARQWAEECDHVTQVLTTYG
jgi:hypothetical protein